MNIVFMGAKQGGMIGLLTIGSYFSMFNTIMDVISYDEIVGETWVKLGFQKKVFKSLKEMKWEDPLLGKYNYDLLISIHGREIVSNEILSKFKYGGINLHPMLSKYKGANPITRFMTDSLHGKTDNMASVGVHRMTDVLDGGEVLSEKFIEIDSPWEKSPAEIYNELYHLYPLVLMEAIKKICG